MPPRYRTGYPNFRAFAECSCGRSMTTKVLRRHLKLNPGHQEVRRFERFKLSQELLQRRQKT